MRLVNIKLLCIKNSSFQYIVISTKMEISSKLKVIIMTAIVLFIILSNLKVIPRPIRKKSVIIVRLSRVGRGSNL